MTNGQCPIPNSSVWTAEAANHIQHVYLNGVVTGTDAWLSHASDVLEGTTNNWLGRSQFVRDPPLNGQIDEFRIYQGALSPLEVAANYQRGPDADPGEHGAVTALRLDITNSLAAGEVATAALYASVPGLTNRVNLTSNPGLLISFFSADPGIATVDAAGKVLGISAGETEINGSYGHVRASARVRVVQHLSDAGEPPAAGEPGVRTKSPDPNSLNLEGRCVSAGQFLPGEHLQDLMLPKAAVARYFCLESRSAFDGLRSAAVAELDLLDDRGRPLSHEGWRVCYAESEEHEGRNMRENLLDGNLDTAWVTQFSKANPNHPHRIILDLGKPLRIAGFRYVPRRRWEGIQGSVLDMSRETIRALVEAGRMELGAAPAAAELHVGDWIWTTNVTDRQTCRLWRDFTVPKPGVSSAELRITADDTYVAYLDGQQVGHGADANSLTPYDVTRLLCPGRHVLAVEALNEGMNAGVLAGLHMTLPDGHSADVLSDNSWRVADNHDARWKTARQSAPSWIHAETVGYAGKDWWQYPRTIFNAPPLLPPVIHVWQRTWFVSLVLGLSAFGLAFTLRQRLQLAVQNRSTRLLEDLVQQRTSELRRAQEHLEEQVAQRTAELKQTNELLQQDITKREQAEAALLQARTELEKVSRTTTMGELAASIAHEVNQPLAGVVTSANASLNWLAANPPNMDKARESMKRVLRDGTRAGEVLERIRSLFRRSAATTSALNLNQVVRDVIALAGGEWRQRKVELSLELADPLPAIMGDSIQLQQVLVNLIRNAVEAMAEIEDRPKTLHITSGVGDLEGKPAVLVTVTDSGVGFAATDPKRLFEAFQTTKPKGMGMGLWISRSIIEAHGGTLTAYPNQRGPGATFQILIPVLTEGQA